MVEPADLAITIVFLFLIIVVAGFIITFLVLDYRADIADAPFSNFYFSRERSNFGGTNSSTGVVAHNSMHSPASALTVRTCNASTNSVWSAGRCSCLEPWYGNSCNMQRFSQDYTAMGTVARANLEDACLVPVTVDAKSFTAGSCTTACDNRGDSCVGVVYRQADNNTAECSLIVSPTVTTNLSNINYNLEVDSTLYLKNHLSLRIRNIVYLSVFPVARRFWLVPNSGDFQALPIGGQVNIFFTPNYAHVDGDNRYGIYTNSAFAPSLYATDYMTLNSRPGFYVHKPDTALEVPIEMRGLPSGLFVTYY